LAEEQSLSAIDLQVLQEAGFVSKNDKVKILGKGELTVKLDVKAHAFSKSAKEAIEKLEGTTEIL
jgi:large subunit ribosomal protein L15